MVNTWHFGKSYFQCSLIESIFRKGLLYSIEACYNLNEKERKIEKIEENFLRELFKTGRNFNTSILF